MNDVLGYAGRRVVVAGGGGGGMGASTTRILVELGAEVHVLDLREPPCEVAAYAAADLGDRRAIEKAVAGLGTPVDCLFNCQGISGTAPETSRRDLLLVNFIGVRYLTERVLPLMSEGGAIVTVSSAGSFGWQANLEYLLALVESDGWDGAVAWCADHPEGDATSGGGFASYAFAKQCVVAWTMRRAVELAARGIRVNCTSPGATASPMMPEFQAASPPGYIAAREAPSGRSSHPDEQAWPLVFLNSHRASYVSGVNLSVDGGSTAGQLVGLIDMHALAAQLQD